MAWLAGGGTRFEQFPAELSLTLNWLGRARRSLWDGRRLWWFASIGDVMVVVEAAVVTATVTMVYLGHAIDFHVALAIHSSLLSAKSETKCRRNCIENFFRNPAYIRRRIRRCTKNDAYVFDIWKFSRRKFLSKEGTRSNPSRPSPRFPSLPLSLPISDKKQTFTRCRWFAPILSLFPKRGSFYRRVTVFG